MELKYLGEAFRGAFAVGLPSGYRVCVVDYNLRRKLRLRASVQLCGIGYFPLSSSETQC
jgi:hypothetical protein